ncbi:hypothetical protein [Bradyrhizobium sp. USDA 4503]
MSHFWTGKRVFLTGHTGFNGSWLALWLQHFGARVTGYALPAMASLFKIRVGAGMESILGNVTNYNRLVSTFVALRPMSLSIRLHNHQCAIPMPIQMRPIAPMSWERCTYCRPSAGELGPRRAQHHLRQVLREP